VCGNDIWEYYDSGFSFTGNVMISENIAGIGLDASDFFGSEIGIIGDLDNNGYVDISV